MKYRIISTVEANNLIFNKNKSRIIRLEAITTCHVNQLEDGRFILMPFDSPTSAIFDDMASCLAAVEHDIDMIRTPNPFEAYKDEMLGIEDSWSTFIATLEQLLGREVRVTTDIAYLKKLNKDILKLGDKHLLCKRLYVPLSVYIGAILKQVVNGQWTLLTCNMSLKYEYYIPKVTDVNGLSYFPSAGILDSCNWKGKFDLITFVKKSTKLRDIDVSGDIIVRVDKWKQNSIVSMPEPEPGLKYSPKEDPSTGAKLHFVSVITRFPPASSDDSGSADE